MENKLWEIFKRLFIDGLVNEDVVMVEDIPSTKEHFGTATDISLKGKWIAIYGDAFCPPFLKVEASLVMKFCGENENDRLYLYQID